MHESFKSQIAWHLINQYCPLLLVGLGWVLAQF
jgi:hypothetical protein